MLHRRENCLDCRRASQLAAVVALHFPSVHPLGRGGVGASQKGGHEKCLMERLAAAVEPMKAARMALPTSLFL